MIIVIANSYDHYKKWCIENNIDIKSKDCQYRYMINEYSIRGRNISELIDISFGYSEILEKYNVLARYAVAQPINIIEN